MMTVSISNTPKAAADTGGPPGQQESGGDTAAGLFASLLAMLMTPTTTEASISPSDMAAAQEGDEVPAISTDTEALAEVGGTDTADALLETAGNEIPWSPLSASSALLPSMMNGTAENTEASPSLSTDESSSLSILFGIRSASGDTVNIDDSGITLEPPEKASTTEEAIDELGIPIDMEVSAKAPENTSEAPIPEISAKLMETPLIRMKKESSTPLPEGDSEPPPEIPETISIRAEDSSSLPDELKPAELPDFTGVSSSSEEAVDKKHLITAEADAMIPKSETTSTASTDQNLPPPVSAPVGGIHRNDSQTTTEASRSTPSVDVNNLVPETTNQIKISLRQEEHHVTLRLSPESLGEVHVDITGKQGEWVVRMSSSNPATTNLFERHADQLRHSLTQSGFDGITVEVNTGMPSGSNEYSGRQAQQQAYESKASFTQTYRQSTMPANHTALESTYRRNHSGNLNLLV